MSQQSHANRPSGFDWPVYADATFAGLAVLIPIPLLDLLVEALFRRRIASSVAAHRDRRLHPGTLHALNHRPLSLFGCLLLPVGLVLLFLKRLFRTILYFLTVKDATDSLSRHWHRAFLIDLALYRGQLDDAGQASRAVGAIDAVLGEISTSPLNRLAAQVVQGLKRRLFVNPFGRARKQEVARAARERLGHEWRDLRGYFDRVSAEYDRQFAALSTESAEVAAPTIRP